MGNIDKLVEYMKVDGQGNYGVVVGDERYGKRVDIGRSNCILNNEKLMGFYRDVMGDWVDELISRGNMEERRERGEVLQKFYGEIKYDLSDYVGCRNWEDGEERYWEIVGKMREIFRNIVPEKKRSVIGIRSRGGSAASPPGEGPAQSHGCAGDRRRC